MNSIYLLLGSNEGKREDWLNKAIDLLEASCGPVIMRSALYETAAWGLEDQPDFLNMALYMHTSLSATELLAATQEIEKQLGRQRELKWGQRTLDIDILFYNSDIIDSPQLKVPHPYLQERRFALVPLAEIAPQFIHPLLQKTVTQLLADCPDTLEVRQIQ